MFIARVKDDKGYECFLTFKAENDDKFDDELERHKLELIEKIQVSGLVKDFIQYNYADTDYNNNFVVILDTVTNKEYILVLPDEKVKAISKFLANTLFKIININPITTRMANYIKKLEVNSKTNTKKNLDEIIEIIYTRTNNNSSNIEILIGDLLNNLKDKTGMSREEALKFISDLSDKAVEEMKKTGIELPKSYTDDFLKKLENFVE